MKKFVFNFNDFEGSLSRLCDFIDYNLELNVRYHVCLSSLDCKVVCNDIGLGMTYFSECTITDEFRVDALVNGVSIERKIMFLQVCDDCNCKCDSNSIRCFNIMNIYFVEYVDNIKESDLMYMMHKC